MRAILAIRATFLALCFGLLACGESPPAPPGASEKPAAPPEPGERGARSPAPPGSAAPGYVGSTACRDCHAEEFARWRGSHHDLAMQEVRPETVLGDFGDRQLDHHGERTRFYREGDRFLVETVGPDGVRREYPVAYVFGADPLQQLLLRLPGGRLQAFGWAWDARTRGAGGQRWFHLYQDRALAPGSPLHWSGRDQNWNFMCAECHSTGLARGFDAETQRFETRWQEIDVACEACHGPGAEHARVARRDPRGSGAAIVSLKRPPGEWRLRAGAAIASRSQPAGDPADEIDTCAPCHSRRSSLGHGMRPGSPLLDTQRPEVLTTGLYFPDGQILDEVYVYASFAQSAMHAAGVRCSDCHDPHSLALKRAGSDAQRGSDGTCLQCHDAAAFASEAHHFHAEPSPAARCSACHMPTRTYMGIDVRHDHSFRVPRPDLEQRLGSELPNPCTACHEDRDARWAAAVLAARGLASRSEQPHFSSALNAARTRAHDAEKQLIEVLARAAVAPIVRATALTELGNLATPDAPKTIEAIHRALRSADGLIRLSAVRAASALEAGTQLRFLEPLLEDPLLAVRVDTARALLEVPPQLWRPAGRSKLAAALAEYRQVQLATADRPEAQLNLAALAARQGEAEPALAAARRALALAPDADATALNLADLLRATGRESEALATLDAGIARIPESAALHHARGLALVRAGRRDEALQALERAAALGPEVTRYAYVVAIALSGLGRIDDALATLERANTRDPADRATLQALISINRDAGRIERARFWAQRLLDRSPESEAAQKLIQELAAAISPTPGPP